jgi:hypothetical protein
MMNITKKDIVGTWSAPRRKLILLSDSRFSLKSEANFFLSLMMGIVGAPGSADENISGNWAIVDGGISLEISDSTLRFWRITDFESERMTIIDCDENTIHFTRA